MGIQTKPLAWHVQLPKIYPPILVQGFSINSKHWVQLQPTHYMYQYSMHSLGPLAFRNYQQNSSGVSLELCGGDSGDVDDG